MLQVLKSREDCFSPLSQQESLDGAQGPLSGEEEIDKAAGVSSETANHTMRLLTLGASKTLLSSLEKSSVCPGE